MASRPYHIVVAEPYSESALAALRGAGRVRVLDSYDEPSLLTAVADADALLVRTYAQVTARVLEAAPRLQVVGRGGVGLENVDLSAAHARRVIVVYTPAAATRSVAELTLGLMIALERGVLAGDEAVRTGRLAEARRVPHGRELQGRTVGIVGLGRIGRAVARSCGPGLGMRVLYNDIVDVGRVEFPAESASKPVLFRESDVVSLHVPLTKRTRHLINADVLATFKPTTTLINTARGAVVDLIALADALRSGRLAGAALDVFDPEPLPRDHPILSAPNVLCSPHVGARTHEGLARMNDVVHDVIAVLEGRSPQYPAPADEVG
jgi:D-3-phosphoglycerate dehydrogenase